MKVFIVEDSPALVQAVSDLLSEIDGVEIAGSTGVVERATEEIRRLRPDIVILDIRLADGSGLDVLRNIKSRTSDAPLVIVFSSNTEPGYRRACERLGADFVFDKSQDYNKLPEVIRSKVSSINSGSEGK
ncbi:MAG TPA: response regulator transcription factor [Bryobacteraceae bacterium]|jgi:DNA-binding NarL/FixJ family response regulator|nr:response regulator transcription factor [Bryobacteraceae bacterium]